MALTRTYFVPRKSKKTKGETPTKNRQLWADAGADNVFQLLLEKFPDKHWVRKGEHIVGCCPFHADDTASFIVTPIKGIAKCFGCNVVFLDFLAFIKRVVGGSTTQAAQIVRKRFNLKAAVSDTQFEKLQAEEVAQAHLLKFFEFCGQTLIEAAAEYPAFANKPHLYFAKTTLEGLRERRLGYPAPNELRAVGDDENSDPLAIDPHGLLLNFVSNQLLAVIPPMAMINNFYKDDPDGLIFIKKYWGPFIESGGSYQGFFILPYHTAPGVFGCFKLRDPNRANKKLLLVGRDPEDQSRFYGYYGLHKYRVWLGPTTITGAQLLESVTLTEGEFCTLQCIAHQERLGGEDSVFLCVGGGSAQPPDALADIGITRIYLNQDDDDGGYGMVKRVLSLTKAPTLNYYVFQWPKEYRDWRSQTDPNARIKDPDEAVVQFGYPRWRRYSCSPDSYITALDWVFEKSNRAMSEMAAGDVRKKSDEALEWGRLLLNEHECRKYYSSIAAHHDLDDTYLLRRTIAKDEDEQNFVDRLLATLQDKVHFVGLRSPEVGKRTLVFYNKSKKVIDSLPVGDLKAIEAIFSSYFGTLYDFVATEMGEPGFMAPADESGDTVSTYGLAVKSRKYAEYINFAIQKAIPTLPSLDHTPMKAQGYHYFGEKDGAHTSYLVNGSKVFHLVHASGVMKATLLEGPSHDGVLFNTRDKAWYEPLKTTEDLTESKANPLDLFVTMRDMLNKGWGWEHDKDALDATFLAAFCMCVPVMNAFTRQVAIILNAEKQSGKSKFLGGFLGGHEFPEMHLVAHTFVMNGYTEASIRQQRDGSTLCLCLEEFEDEGGNERRSVTVRRALELFRDLISGAEVNWSVGTLSGQAKVYKLRFPLACTAIHPLRDGASLSRFVPFALKHDTAKADPQHVLLKTWGKERILQMKHDLAVGMYQHVPAIRVAQAAVTDEYSSGELLPAYVPARFREALIPVLTMLRFLSELPGGADLVPNYRTFAQEFSACRKDFLTQLHTTSVNEQIFQSLLESPFRVQGTDSLTTTIRAMLGDLNELDNINKTHQGVFIDKKKGWLVVPWIQACQGVLANTAFKHEKPVYLKKIAERSPHYVPVEVAKQARVLEDLAPVMGPGVPHDLVTVFSIKHLIKETEDMWKDAKGEVSGEAPAASTEPAGNSSPNHIDDIGV